MRTVSRSWALLSRSPLATSWATYLADNIVNVAIRSIHRDHCT